MVFIEFFGGKEYVAVKIKSVISGRKDRVINPAFFHLIGFIQNRGMYFIKAVRHPYQFGLILQMADQARYRRWTFRINRRDLHTGKSIGPAFF